MPSTFSYPNAASLEMVPVKGSSLQAASSSPLFSRVRLGCQIGWEQPSTSMSSFQPEINVAKQRPLWVL